MPAITGPAALIALASRLGIAKGAKIIAEKGFKYLQRQVNRALKQQEKVQKSAGKAFKGKGPQRKQEKVTQRKEKDKSKVDSDLSITEKGGTKGIKSTIKTTKKPEQKFRGTVEAAHGIKHIKNFKTKEEALNWVNNIRRHKLAGIASGGKVTKLP